jgi:hypothetical protein
VVRPPAQRLTSPGAVPPQVSWREQLLASAIEELPKYAALTSGPSSGPGSTEHAAPAQVYARIGLAVVVLAAAVSCLAEGLHLHEYACAAAREAAARGNGLGSTKKMR